MPLPLAHAGHYALWVLYVVPVLVVVGAIVRSVLLTRRAIRAEEQSPEDESRTVD